MWIDTKKQLPEPYEYVLVYHFAEGTNEPCPMSVAQHNGREWQMLARGHCGGYAWTNGDLDWAMSEDEIDMWHPMPPKPNVDLIRDATEMLEESCECAKNLRDPIADHWRCDKCGKNAFDWKINADRR